MSYGSAETEQEIQRRMRWLAEAVALRAGVAQGICAGRDLIAERAHRETPPPVDQVTWFAIERLGVNGGVPVLRMDRKGLDIAAGSVVWVDPSLPVDLGDAQRLQQHAALVVARADWMAALAVAAAMAMSVDALDPPKDRADGVAETVRSVGYDERSHEKGYRPTRSLIRGL